MHAFHVLIIGGAVKFKFLNAVYKNEADSCTFMFILILKISQNICL